MSKRLITFMLVLLVLGGATLSAQERASALSFETDVQLDVAFFGMYLATEPHLVWRPGWFGLGAGVKLIAGATQFDVHAAPFARVELGWFYANAGWVVEIVDRSQAYQAIDDGFYSAAGIAPDLLQFGYGRLGVDLGVEYYHPIDDPGSLDAPVSRLVAPWGVSLARSSFLESILGNSFARMGILYTFPL
ncbi:MAG: hypothetical protein ACOC7V_06795 [Spirochaetota bacterium]